MKVLVITQHNLLLESFAQFSGLQHRNITIVPLHSNLLNASQAIAAEQPDVVMIDVTSDESHVFELTERFKVQHQNTIFMLLTSDSSTEVLIKAIRSGFSEVLHLPVTEQSISHALERLITKKNLSASSNSKVISVISSKGGSGATFVATNLAFALAAECRKKVLVLDTNHFFGDAAMYVSDEQPSVTLAQVCEQIHRLDIAFLESSLVHVTDDFKLLPANNDPAKVADILPEHLDKIIRLARNYFDFIIVDTGRQIDAMTVKILDASDIILPIVQLSLPYIRDTKSLLKTFNSLGYGDEKVKIIVNRYFKDNKLTIEDLQLSIQRNVETTIPNEYLSAIDSVNQGIAVCKLYPNSVISKKLVQLAHMLSGSTPVQPSSFLAKLFRV